MTVNPNNNPLAYLGVVAQTPPDEIVAQRDPTAADIHYPVGTQWTNESAGNQFVLVRYVAGVPDWALATAASGDVTELTPSSGTSPVTPSAGNINITAGTGIQTVGSANTITINAVGGGVTWSTVTTDTAAAVNHGYVTNKAATPCVVTLPTTFAVGAVVIVTGLNSAGWTVTAGTATNMVMNGTTGASAGTAGFTSQYQTIYLTGLVANTTWTVAYSSDVVTLST